MIALYMLAFCRMVTGLVFAFSSISKARDLSQFTATIANFRLLPRSLHAPAAFLFLGGEFAVAVLTALGGQALPLGFGLASVLLLLFCGALASVLARGLHTSCNCFGASKRPVTSADIWRNLGLLLCAAGGWSAFLWTRGTRESLGAVEWLLVMLGSLAFVLIWTQLGEIAQLFRQS